MGPKSKLSADAKVNPEMGPKSHSSADVKLNPEEFVKFLSNDEFLEKLRLILEPVITFAVQEAIKPIQINFQTKLDDFSATIKALQTDLKLRSKTMNLLEAANSELQAKLSAAEVKLEESEQYNSRRDNLIISGLPATLSEITAADATKREVEYSSTSVQNILDICRNVLNIQINESDVVTAHRLRASRNSKHPPILVSFTRCIVCCPRNAAARRRRHR